MSIITVHSLIDIILASCKSNLYDFSMITELDQQTHDIDWFFTTGDKISFVASGCGKLPRSIATMTLDRVNLLSAYFRTLPQITEVIINPALDEIRGRRTNEKYLSDFVAMAKRGLHAFDKTFFNHFEDSNYHLVASPVDSLLIDQLPLNIQDLIRDIQFEYTNQGSRFSYKAH